MLFPSKMLRASIIIHKDYLEKAIDVLHERGLIQIISIRGSEATESEEASECRHYEERISKIISILKKYRGSRGGLVTLLYPEKPRKKEVRKRSLEVLFSEAEKLLKPLEEKVYDLYQRVKLTEDEIKILDSNISKLSLLASLDVDLSYIGETKYTVTKVGITSSKELVEKGLEEIGIAGYKLLDKKKNQWLVIATCHSSDKERMERIWHNYVSDLALPKFSGRVTKVIRELYIKRARLYTELKKTKLTLKKIADKFIYDLLALKEEIGIERAKKEIKSNFGKTNFTYVIEGWVLAKKSRELKKLLEEVTRRNVSVYLTNPSSNPEEPPTHLEIPSSIRPFKPILQLFGLPKHNEVNPLLFLAIWFPLMFGFMLGDAGYGLVLLILSLFSRFKWGKTSPFVKSWSIVIALFGFWSMVFGFLSNSFFGDLLPRYFGVGLPSFELAGLKIPVDGLRKPIFWLQISLILGLVHLNIGIALGLIQNLRFGRFKELFSEQISFIFLQIFGGALIGEHLLKIWKLSHTFEITSYVGSLLGILLLAIKVRGMTFLEIMGFVGDWLSYARLLALGLATTGMAIAFNIVAQLLGNLTNVALTIIILLIAHPVTLILNTIGAAVHSLRLQYVEFFNRFYEGGGKEFTPFHARRKYTKLVEV